MLLYTHSRLPRRSTFGMSVVRRSQVVRSNARQTESASVKTSENLCWFLSPGLTLYPSPVSFLPWKTDVLFGSWFGSANSKSSEGYERETQPFLQGGRPALAVPCDRESLVIPWWPLLHDSFLLSCNCLLLPFPEMVIILLWLLCP